MADSNDGSSGASLSREGGGGGAPQFADFSSFPEMIQEEREPALLAECEAADAEARVERETVAAEQRRLMAEFFELNLQLAKERKRQWGVARGEPWTAWSHC